MTTQEVIASGMTHFFGDHCGEKQHNCGGACNQGGLDCAKLKCSCECHKEKTFDEKYDQIVKEVKAQKLHPIVRAQVLLDKVRGIRRIKPPKKEDEDEKENFEHDLGVCMAYCGPGCDQWVKHNKKPPKIEKIHPALCFKFEQVTMHTVILKLNELIDAVNELRG